MKLLTLLSWPMLELIDYLEANSFTVYIFTADEAAFLRLASLDLYGLPPSQVQGSAVRNEFVVQKGEAKFVRSYRLQYLNNWAGKPQPEFHKTAAAGIIILLAVLLSFNAVAIFIRQKFQKPLQ